MREIEISFTDKKHLHLGDKVEVVSGKTQLIAFKLEKGLDCDKRDIPDKTVEASRTHVFEGGVSRWL